MLDFCRRTRFRASVVVVPALLALAAMLALPAAAAPGGNAGDGPYLQGDKGKPGLPDLDTRHGKRAPTAAQKAATHGAAVVWNQFGTPASLIDYGGYLAAGLSADPVEAARSWLRQNAELMRLTPDTVDGLQLVASSSIGAGRAVLFQQRFGDLPAGFDGLVTVGVVDGKVAYVSSSIAGDEKLTGSPQLSAPEAYVRAASDVGIAVSPSDVSVARTAGPWTVLDVAGLSEPQYARLVAVPTPEDGAVPAWEVVVTDTADSAGYTEYVDARSGDVVVRQNTVDNLSDDPTWRAFRAYPPLDYSTTDTRQLWCWTATAGCDLTLQNPSSPLAWDVNPATNLSTNTTSGSNDQATEDWNSNQGSHQGTNFATPSPTRDYTYAWTNEWQTTGCNPDDFTSAARNDIDAADANLFAMHNRMHDFAYKLGFIEGTWNAQVSNFGGPGLGNDPEHGNAQKGGIVGGPPAFQSRDNANQNSPPDGISPTSNMFLWQPIAGSFYAPCVDGDFDMSVIGHEYTHLISNRMVAGPNQNLSGFQAGSMGESWSDLDATEYLSEYGFIPVDGENPTAVGAYVTGEPKAGIRNYPLNRNPLNYSDVGYDTPGPEVHSDGEIWNGVNWAVRQAMIDRYGAGDAALQQSCADGLTPVGSCPGNRRWIQLVYDAWLLMANGAVTMLDARNAMLAADVIRFGGVNQDLLWNVFASRGFGKNASTTGPSDTDPVPSFESDYADNATATFKAIGDADGHPVQLYVGDYQARAVPIADTDPATPLADTFEIVPGTYSFIARGDGFGEARVTASFLPGQVRDLPVNMPRNLASSFSGATATGDGSSLGNLIDDNEATRWVATGAPLGKQVTVRLDPSLPAQQIARVEVSAMIGPNTPPPNDNRFSALRQFQVLTCEAKSAVDCSQDGQFTLIYTSPPDAFPSVAPRPRAPELIVRSFDLPKTKATHVRLRVVTNQCTGGADFAGEQDNDPRANTDCTTAGPASAAQTVHAAEFQVFSK